MRLLLLRPRPSLAAVVATALALCATACSTRAAPSPEPDRPTKIGCAGGGGASWVVPIFGAATGQVAASARIGTGPCGFAPTGVVAATPTACVPTDLVIGAVDARTQSRSEGLRPVSLPCLPRPIGGDDGVSAAARAGITWRTLTPGAAMTDTPPTKPLPDLPDEPIPTPMPADPPTPQPGQPSS